MRVLLTGGLGAIGSWVTRELVEAGHDVTLYDWRPDTALIADVVGHVRLVTGDILDLPAILRACKESRAERIIHLAAIMPPACQANPPLGLKVNTWGLVNILEAARLMDISRVVYTSSKGAYGAVLGEHGHPTYKPLSEGYPRNPDSVYGTTKLASEHMAWEYVRNYGLDVLALRLSSTYGPGKLARHGPMGTQSRMIETVMAGQPVRIPQGRDQKDDLVYNRDVGHAVVLACMVERTQDRVFNIGTGRLSGLTEMAEVLSQIYPKALIDIGPGLNYMQSPQPHYCLYDISRARKELGYEPQFPVDRGVRDYVDTMEKLKLVPAAQ